MAEVLTIDRMSSGSQGVAHLSSGKTVFVEGAFPGDTVEAQVYQEKDSYAFARTTEILEYSTHRAKPFCPMDTVCGGCEWQGLDYAAQLEYKREAVVAALVHNAHFQQEQAESLVAPTEGCKRQIGYRNKIELACLLDAQGRVDLGFHKEGSDAVVKVPSCPAAVKPIQKAPRALSGALRFALGSNDCGLFRVGVRSSLRTHSTEIALWTTPGALPRAHVASILSQALKCTSIVRVIADPGKARKVKKVEVLEGSGNWEETLADCKFLTSAPSFFQVNTGQAEKLVRYALQGLGDVDGAYVADLYSGGGTFTIPLAKAGADVVAVEAAGSSVRDLRRNAEMNNVEIDVVCDDTAREIENIQDVDALIVDPPRSGLAQGVPESIRNTGAQQVCYVSCNPQTWARDARALCDLGFTLRTVQPVDMFPQTHHCEVVSHFQR